MYVKITMHINYGPVSRMNMDKKKKQQSKLKGVHLQEEPQTTHSFRTPSQRASKDEAKERKM